MASRRPHAQPPPFHPNRPGLLTPVRIDPDGRDGPTGKQARGPGWRKTSHGYYLPASVDAEDVDQRIAAAAVVVPDGGAVTGWAALRWLGVDWLDGRRGPATLPVTVAVVHSNIRAQGGIAVTSEFVRTDEILVVDGLPVTTALRSATFEARHAADLVRAVMVLDMAAAADLVSRQELADSCAALMAPTGVGRLREAIGLMDENVWSPMETEARLLLMRRLGLSRLACNRPVFDLDGRHIGTPDLLDPVVGMVFEYNGAVHLEGAQRAKDVAREAAFRRVGLEYVEMMAADRRDPDAFLIRSREARGRALDRPRGERRWTVTPPPWWTPTLTVAQRRGLSPWQRDRFLRYRAG